MCDRTAAAFSEGSRDTLSSRAQSDPLFLAAARENWLVPSFHGGLVPCASPRRSLEGIPSPCHAKPECLVSPRGSGQNPSIGRDAGLPGSGTLCPAAVPGARLGILPLKSAREWAVPRSWLVASVSSLMPSLLPLPSGLTRAGRLCGKERKGGKGPRELSRVAALLIP